MFHWYVIQVRNGSEEKMLAAINREFEEEDDGILKECFSPRWQTQEKSRGEWRTVERKLLPGYLIAITEYPEKLEAGLRCISGFSRLLSGEEGYLPLTRQEACWIDRHTQGRARVLPMSEAIKDGDVVTVVSGPLLDKSFKVTRIDRRRSTAYIEMSFLGRTKEVPVGLKILTKKE